jgi:hypothetical protein
MTRREFTYKLAAGCVALAGTEASFSQGTHANTTWTKDWDRAVLLSAVKRADASFDPKEGLLFHTIGPEYHYHTNLRSTRAHITRDSLDYAMNLLETGEPDRKRRAEEVLTRMLDLQDTDPNSKWYGLWGYYMEEPASKMSPADWNWADFNGATLLMINARHGSQLSAALRDRVRQAIHHCAVSVMRRNVVMTYTNIAVQGTFVTLAAAALLHDETLSKYAHERLRRFCATVNETGSFAEYNSPTYANVTILNLVRMKMLLEEPETIRILDRLHERIWMHLGDHWHSPTHQLAGPMSRCYNTDIGKPLWLQKSLGGEVPFATLEEIQEGRIHESGEVSYLEYSCPESVRGKFLAVPDDVEHRELFLYSGKPEEPVTGATYLTKAYTIGSANRSDFWIQRRPLLAYWGGRDRPAHYLQMRFVKDDYDFSSALFFAVQAQNYVVCLVNFRSPGGDKHPTLDPIQDGRFEARRMRVRFDLAQVPQNAKILADGRPAAIDKRYPPATRLSLDLAGAYFAVQFHGSALGEERPGLTVAREDDMLTVSLDLLASSQPRTVSWADIRMAFAAATIAMAAPDGALEDFDRQTAALDCTVQATGGQSGKMDLAWKTPAGKLAILGATSVGTVDEQNESIKFAIDGRAVPIVRLSNEKILSA